MKREAIRDQLGFGNFVWLKILSRIFRGRPVPNSVSFLSFFSLFFAFGILEESVWAQAIPRDTGATTVAELNVEANDGDQSEQSMNSSQPLKEKEDAEARVDTKAPGSGDSPLAVTTRVTPNPSHIGDELTLEVTVAYPVGYTVNLPTGIKFEPFHRVEIREGEIESTGTGLRKTFQIVLQQFEVGEIKIPRFPITYVDAQGSVQTTTVPAKSIQVESLLANETEPTRKGEDLPVSLEYPNFLAETIIYSAVASLLVAALGAWVIVRYRRRARPVYVPPPVPADEQALEALKELDVRRDEMVNCGEVQEYYVELTEIAKAYCQGRFGIEALDRTTEEIRRLLVRSPHFVEPLSGVEVIRFLEECDLVKFARFTPSLESAEEATEQVRNMVERSRPQSKVKSENNIDSSKEVA